MLQNFSDEPYLLNPDGITAVDRHSYAAPSFERRGFDYRASKLRQLNDQFRDATWQRNALRGKFDSASPEERGAIEGEIKVVEKRITDIKEKKKPFDDRYKQVNYALAASVGWQCHCKCPFGMIVAGKMIFAGGRDEVVAVNAATGKIDWTGKAAGRAHGLLVSDGRLFVSTDRGNIHCFAQGPAEAKTIQSPTDASPYPADELTPIYAAAAERIVKETGITKGYCIDLGCGTGRLAYELAKRTELKIYGIESDAGEVATARKALDAAGLYGVRVTIDHASLTTRLPYSDYCANLIVSDRMLRTGTLPDSAKELFRVLKPVGGVAYLGQPGEQSKISADTLRKWFEEAKVPGVEVSSRGGLWAKLVRGPLKGAGRWTHQYADAGNTGCSDENLVRCPLGLLWFGKPGPANVIGRHYNAPAPVAANGRFFIQSVRSVALAPYGDVPRPNHQLWNPADGAVMAVDSYNGLLLWERRIGALRTSVRTTPGTLERILDRTAVGTAPGSLAATDDSVFVLAGANCLRLDAATGRTKRTYAMPPAKDDKPRYWGYIAYAGNHLYGTRAENSHSPRFGDALFALDIESGQCRWIHEGKRICNVAIAIGGGRIFLLERSDIPQQRRRARRRQAPDEKEDRDADVHCLIALDARSGKQCWRSPVTSPVDPSNPKTRTWDGLCDYFAATHKDGVLLLEIGDYSGYLPRGKQLIAFSANDGSLLWSRDATYRRKPVIVGDVVYAEPMAYDLRTGATVNRVHPVSGRQVPWEFRRFHGCGGVSACPSCLFFRSSSIGYYDLLNDYGTILNAVKN